MPHGLQFVRVSLWRTSSRYGIKQRPFHSTLRCVKQYQAKTHQNRASVCSVAGWFVSLAIDASGERNSMTPVATQVTCTRRPGLKPACSSHRPMRRILGLIRPFHRSPSASICSVRTVGCGLIRVGDCKAPDIAMSKGVRCSSIPFSGDSASGQWGAAFRCSYSR